MKPQTKPVFTVLQQLCEVRTTTLFLQDNKVTKSVTVVTKDLYHHKNRSLIVW